LGGAPGGPGGGGRPAGGGGGCGQGCVGGMRCGCGGGCLVALEGFVVEKDEEGVDVGEGKGRRRGLDGGVDLDGGLGSNGGVAVVCVWGGERVGVCGERRAWEGHGCGLKDEEEGRDVAATLARFPLS
jgi:hypothetical protein